MAYDMPSDGENIYGQEGDEQYYNEEWQNDEDGTQSLQESYDGDEIPQQNNQVDCISFEENQHE